MGIYNQDFSSGNIMLEKSIRHPSGDVKKKLIFGIQKRGEIKDDIILCLCKYMSVCS